MSNHTCDVGGTSGRAQGAGLGATEDRIAQAMRVLMDRERPDSLLPDRNHRIEEAIMAGSAKRLSKRHVWAGGVLLLLAGSAIGAVATNIITQRFTGYVELEDGRRVQVEGEMMIETEGDQKQVTINAENLPQGQITGGEWRTEDGRVILVQPVQGGAEATLTVPADAGTQETSGGN